MKKKGKCKKKKVWKKCQKTCQKCPGVPDCSLIELLLSADGITCISNCTIEGETNDSNGDGQCDAKCSATGDILNAAGNACLNDCNEFGETLESNQSNQCGINCASVGKILNAAGDKCLADCSIEGEFTNAEGSACLNNCTDGGEITNAAGNNDFTCFIVYQHLKLVKHASSEITCGSRYTVIYIYLTCKLYSLLSFNNNWRKR